MGNETKPKTRKSGKTLQTAREAGYFGKKMLNRGRLSVLGKSNIGDIIASPVRRLYVRQLSL